MNNEPLTVREVIEQLGKIENKEIPLFIFNDDNIFTFTIDDSMEDRIDLNMNQEVY